MTISFETEENLSMDQLKELIFKNNNYYLECFYMTNITSKISMEKIKRIKYEIKYAKVMYLSEEEYQLRCRLEKLKAFE
jgi:ribosome-interacting GTPase 1